MTEERKIAKERQTDSLKIAYMYIRSNRPQLLID